MLGRTHYVFTLCRYVLIVYGAMYALVECRLTHWKRNYLWIYTHSHMENISSSCTYLKRADREDGEIRHYKASSSLANFNHHCHLSLLWGGTHSQLFLIFPFSPSHNPLSLSSCECLYLPPQICDLWCGVCVYKKRLYLPPRSPWRVRFARPKSYVTARGGRLGESSPINLPPSPTACRDSSAVPVLNVVPVRKASSLLSSASRHGWWVSEGRKWPDVPLAGRGQRRQCWGVGASCWHGSAWTPGRYGGRSWPGTAPQESGVRGGGRRRIRVNTK